MIHPIGVRRDVKCAFVDSDDTRWIIRVKRWLVDHRMDGMMVVPVISGMIQAVISNVSVGDDGIEPLINHC